MSPANLHHDLIRQNKVMANVPSRSFRAHRLLMECHFWSTEPCQTDYRPYRVLKLKEINVNKSYKIRTRKCAPQTSNLGHEIIETKKKCESEPKLCLSLLHYYCTAIKRMLLGIFRNINFSKLLCSVNDLFVFVPSESEVFSRLCIVFQRLKLLQRQVRFFAHIIDSGCVFVDPAKVVVITRIPAQDLMVNDGCTPFVRRIKYYLGMVFYYQHFIPNSSCISKPLFRLTAGQKRKGKL